MFTQNQPSECPENLSPLPGFSSENQGLVRPRYLPNGRGVLLFVVRPEPEVLAAKPLTAAPVAARAADTPGEPAESSAFERFLFAMTNVALEAGNTRVAAALPTLFSKGRLKAATLGKVAERALHSRGYLSPEGGAPSASLLAAATAWQRMLQGESADLGACGAHTLDEWGGALLAALLGESPSRADDFKKLLRKAGVLAFGMRAAA